MEGGLLIHAAWALSFVFVWVYRRWFEKVGPPAPEFEAFCATRPLLAEVSVLRGSEAAAVAALRALMPRGETIATHGPWPWIHHVLRVEVTARDAAAELTITGCRPLRTREVRPPALFAVLAEALAVPAVAAQHGWLHPRAYVDVSGRSLGERGWRFAPRGSDREHGLAVRSA